jgi:hypothetical protein
MSEKAARICREPIRVSQHPGRREPVMSAPNVRTIVAAHLKAGGFDGLWVDDCGCEIDDLMPCGVPWICDCQPGHKKPTTTDGGFVIVPDKPGGEVTG